jgi:hypothetical protein
LVITELLLLAIDVDSKHGLLERGETVICAVEIENLRSFPEDLADGAHLSNSCLTRPVDVVEFITNEFSHWFQSIVGIPYTCRARRPTVFWTGATHGVVKHRNKSLK